MDTALKFISCMLLADNLTVTDLHLDNLNEIPVIQADGSELPGFLQSVMEAQKQGHVLIAARKPELIALCRSLNQNLTKNKMAIWENGTLDLTDLLQELRTCMIHTDTQNEFYPYATQHPAMFCDENRVLLRSCNPVPTGEPLYACDGTPWGTLLPEEVHADAYRGTLAEIRSELTETERYTILSMLCNDQTSCAIPEGVLLFRDESCTAVSLPDEKQISCVETELFVLTGLSADAPADELLIALSRINDLQTAVRLANAYCREVVFA